MKRNLLFFLIPAAVLFLYYPVIFTYFSQDDFFHFKVSLTDGTLVQFINLFGFHPFSERGIAFYRPIFREGLFNIFYSLFGLNHYPFRLLQFFLLFLNSMLIYILVIKLLKTTSSNPSTKKHLPYFTSFFYAISAAQVSPLYYLAGGIQVLGATTFLLLSLLLVFKTPAASFIAFLLAIASHELASIIPLLILVLLFIIYPIKQALKKIWLVIPFFLVLSIYLYLEITKIGFSVAEKQYQFIFSLKTLINSYIWYIGWALGLPEMLIDFVFPGFKLNPDLMKYWGNYYQFIFPAFFISISLLLTGAIYLVVKNKQLLFNKIVLFSIFWFFVSLTPVIMLPLHKSTQYLETGLAPFWIVIGFIIFQVFHSLKKFAKAYLFIVVFSLISLSATSAILQRTTYWAAERGKYAQQLIKQVQKTYPTLPKGSTIYFQNDPNYPFIASEWGSSSKQASLILNNQDALRLIYKDPTLNVYYQDKDHPNLSKEKNVYSLEAKIF